MSIDKQKLKDLAQAVKADMKEYGERWSQGDDWFEPELYSPEMNYVKAVSPDVILALLAEIERLEQYAELEAKGSDSAAQDLIRLVRENRELQAENEALRKDAERYRWTAIEGNWLARMFGKWRAHTGEYGEQQPTAWYPSRGEAIDAAISHAKAMAKEVK